MEQGPNLPDFIPEDIQEEHIGEAKSKVRHSHRRSHRSGARPLPRSRRRERQGEQAQERSHRHRLDPSVFERMAEEAASHNGRRGSALVGGTMATVAGLAITIVWTWLAITTGSPIWVWFAVGGALVTVVMASVLAATRPGKILRRDHHRDEDAARPGED